MAYLDLTAFKSLTTAPASYVDEVEAFPGEAGWTLAQLEYWSRKIDARLLKRYATPFAESSDTPTVVKGWLADIVTARLYRKRGVDAQDEQFIEAKEAADVAWAEIKEAAESKEGLFELPLRQSAPGVGGVTKGAPLGYSEGSPYEAFANQRQRAIDEGVI